MTLKQESPETKATVATSLFAGRKVVIRQLDANTARMALQMRVADLDATVQSLENAKTVPPEALKFEFSI